MSQTSMGQAMHHREKIPVGILGATGAVGQRFVEMLIDHPWFDLVALAASERSQGKLYGDVVSWTGHNSLPQWVAKTPLVACQPDLPCRLLFSGLDADVAGDIEKRFAEAGYIIVSNARNYRMDPHVPLLIPEVNSPHLSLLKQQPFGKGMIITNPNCSVIGLTIALKPLLDRFGIEAAHVVTLQAVSGAGIPGVPSLYILDNVIPFINDEESKVETEPLKILGHYSEGKLKSASFKISAQCNRVPVSDGHMACISIKLVKKASFEEIIETWTNFSSIAQQKRLPTAPIKPIHYFHEESFPQPKRHRHLDKGMAVSIGRLRSCSLFDYKFTILSHNTIRGAAGCALLNAELLVSEGYVFW